MQGNSCLRVSFNLGINYHITAVCLGICFLMCCCSVKIIWCVARNPNRCMMKMMKNDLHIFPVFSYSNQWDLEPSETHEGSRKVLSDNLSLYLVSTSFLVENRIPLPEKAKGFARFQEVWLGQRRLEGRVPFCRLSSCWAGVSSVFSSWKAGAWFFPSLPHIALLPMLTVLHSLPTKPCSNWLELSRST